MALIKPESLANKIVKHNKLNGLSSVVIVGSPGSGKSTISDKLSTAIYNRGGYNVHMFYRDDIARLQDVSNALETGNDYILIFEDVSYAEKINKIDTQGIIMYLAGIRHVLKAHMIVIFVVNPAETETAGFLRIADFSIVTSITDQIKDIIIGLFGIAAKPVINKIMALNLIKDREHISFVASEAIPNKLCGMKL